MIMGFFLVRPIPLPEAEGYDEIENTRDDFEEEATRDPSHTPLLDEEEEILRRRNDNTDLENAEDVELNSQRLALRNRSLSRGAAMELDVSPNLHGLKLLINGEFLLLFTILSIGKFADRLKD